MSRKGPNGELEVRDLIRNWWAAVEPDAKVERTPQSGGWHASAAFRVSGDLVFPTGSAWPWSVEVKRREGWSPRMFLRGYSSPVWEWWAQSVRDANKVGLQPMLWARRNHARWLVLLPLEQVQRVPGAPPPAVWFGGQVLADRGATVAPAGYWAEDFLATQAKIWV